MDVKAEMKAFAAKLEARAQKQREEDEENEELRYPNPPSTQLNDKTLDDRRSRAWADEMKTLDKE